MLHSRETDLHEDIFAILSDYENTLLTSSVCVHEFIHLAQIGKLDRGKRKTNPDDILKVKVDATMVNGNFVFQRN